MGNPLDGEGLTEEMSEIIKASEGSAEVLFLFINYAKLVALSLPSRRSS